MGRFNAVCLVLFFGPNFIEHGKLISESLRKDSVQTSSGIICTSNAISGDGTLLRIAATSIPELGTALRNFLSFLPKHLGDNPWARKW
jgi:hypothetical protein